MNALKQWWTPLRLGMLARVLAASVGAYIVVNLANAALAYVLPAQQYQSLLFAMQISFLFYTLAIIWVFSVRTAVKAWIGLLGFALPLLAIDVFFYLRGTL